MKRLHLLVVPILTGCASTSTPIPPPASTESLVVRTVLIDLVDSLRVPVSVDTRATVTVEVPGRRQPFFRVHDDSVQDRLVREAASAVPLATVEHFEEFFARRVTCLPACAKSGFDFFTVRFSRPVVSGDTASVIADVTRGYGNAYPGTMRSRKSEYRLVRGPGEGWRIMGFEVLFVSTGSLSSWEWGSPPP
jgi:hypothetical protein